MEKDYFVPFADFGEDKFEEKRSKFTGPAEATQTTPIYAYRRAFSSYRMGEGSAITMILFVILIIFAAIYFILKKRQDKLYG